MPWVNSLTYCRQEHGSLEEAGPSAAANEPAAAPADDAADWDEDDELLAMQQEAWVCCYLQ